jgi:hypothetical protein
MKISPARVAAFEVLTKIERDKAFSSALLPIAEDELEAKDRALCHALTLGVFGLLKLTYERKIGFLFLAVPLIIVIFFAEMRTSELRYVSLVYMILLFGIPVNLLALFRVLKICCCKLRRKTI